MNYWNYQATFLAGSILAVLAVWVSRKLVRPESDISESIQEVNAQIVK